jgi:hypothetical protein
MADRPPVRGSGADRTRKRLPGPWVPNWTTPRPAETTTPTPRWVKVFGIVGVVLLLLIVVMLLTGHGLGLHMHSGLGDRTAPAGHTAPAGPTLVGVTAFDGRRP